MAFNEEANDGNVHRRTALGRDRVIDLPQPLTGSEDFGAFGTALGAPSVTGRSADSARTPSPASTS
ncbi:hypothetical protein [Streptomyces flaveolus]|uniref:hypothetical protein n=1 Tax=Streptomyces flaveolus TaxID=67297 RepID=UPI00368500FD